MAYFFGFSVINFKRYDIIIVVLYYTKIYLQCDMTTFKAFLAHCGGEFFPHMLAMENFFRLLEI